MTSSPRAGRIHAYLLLGDPEWLVQSVRSYYPFVDKIVASYDIDHLGWSGRPMRTQRCIDLIRSIDRDKKVELLPGKYADPQGVIGEVETRQRQAALDAAGAGADWVLQLDADEVVPHWPTFEHWLIETARADRTTMWFPMRELYAQVRPNIYLEKSRRRILPLPTYAGPLALRPGEQLSYIRLTDSPRVLLPTAGRANRIPSQTWILHFAWVRSALAMNRKATTSAHAAEIDWANRLDEWTRANHHPWRFSLASAAGQTEARMRPTRLRRRYEDPVASFTAPTATVGIAADGAISPPRHDEDQTR